MRGLFCFLVLGAFVLGVEMASIQAGCPGGLGTVHCFADPCMIASTHGCAGHHDAKCVSNYCGGCNAEWFDANGDQVFCAAGK